MNHMRAIQRFALLAAGFMSLNAHAADVVLTMNSYGSVRIGMPIAEVHQQLLQLGRKNLPSPTKTSKTGCDYYEASNELRFMTEDGKVVRIETRESNVVTPSGIKIGDGIEKVRRVLGSRIEETKQHYSDDPKCRTIVLVSGDKRFAIRVEANQTVSEIYAGAEHTIRYVEGCA